ncbi:MAG: diadenylate cyclase CdaA [Candidatus Cloacimonetes bacterium]|nr:diadenylate cyclase CdaA [Candidatus Cloacimonadota bacterium]
MNFLIPKFTDIIDIIIVAIILYRVFFLLKKTGGYQILLGFGLIFLMYFIASVLNLEMMTSFLRVLKDYWVLAFIILFQPEIRNILSGMAKNYDLKTIFKDTRKSIYSQLVSAVSIMAFRKIGALIIIENKRKLDEYIDSGQIVDAQISVKLLLTIFNNKTILHDGAVIIRNNRIFAVKVVLPLSENIEYTQILGTRHLAAVGVSEKSDCFAIIVSEETGKISVTKDGVITRGLSIEELSQRIKDEAGS